MSSELIRQFAMMGLEALVAATLILGLFRLRTRFGLSLLLVTLGVFQPLQVILASSLYVPFWGDLSVSPGSVILFTVSLFAVLLVYIREDALAARKVLLPGV